MGGGGRGGPCCRGEAPSAANASSIALVLRCQSLPACACRWVCYNYALAACLSPLQVLLCEAGKDLLPHGCAPLAFDARELAVQRPEPLRKWKLSERYFGLEDGRLLSWQGQPFLLGTVNMDKVLGK